MTISSNGASGGGSSSGGEEKKNGGSNTTTKKNRTGAEHEEDLRLELIALRERVDKLESDLAGTIGAFLSAMDKLAKLREKYKQEQKEAEDKMGEEKKQWKIENTTPPQKKWKWWEKKKQQQQLLLL